MQPPMAVLLFVIDSLGYEVRRLLNNEAYSKRRSFFDSVEAPAQFLVVTRAPSEAQCTPARRTTDADERDDDES